MAALIVFWDMNLLNLYKEFSCPPALLQISPICLSKFNLSSIVMPSSLTWFSVFIILYFILMVVSVDYFDFLRIIAWNFEGLAIIWLLLSHSIAILDSLLRISISWLRVLSAAESVWSSAKPCSFAFVININKSLINILKRIGPRMDPCGTPEKSSSNSISVIPILTLCFLSLS